MLIHPNEDRQGARVRRKAAKYKLYILVVSRSGLGKKMRLITELRSPSHAALYLFLQIVQSCRRKAGAKGEGSRGLPPL